MPEVGKRDSEGNDRRARGLSLGNQIRLWMLVVGFLPLAALFLFGYLAARNALIEASDEHLVSVVETRKAQMKSWLRERLTDLDVIGGSRDCRELIEQEEQNREHAQVCSYLNSFQTGARDYRALVLYDRSWNWVASSSYSVGYPPDLADKEVRERLRASSGPIITPIDVQGDSTVVLRLANHIKATDGSTQGCVVTALDLTGSFAPILEDRAGLGRTGVVYMADASGRIVLPPVVAKARRLAMLPGPIRERMASKKTGTAHYRNAAGQNVFAGYALLPKRGWVIVAEMDEGESLALLRSLSRGFLVAALLTLLAVIFLSSRVSLRLSRPLGELAEGARRIGKGRRHERVPELAGKEVAEVARALNGMLDSLEESQRQTVQASTLAAVGELGSGVVHEMRNSLSSIKMNVQALEKHARNDPRLSELGRIALDQVRRMEEFLNELLAYARPIELKEERVEVASLLDALARRFGAEAEAKRIRMTVENEGEVRFVRADRKRLEEVLANVLRNALEASGPGGRITLRTIPGPGRAEFWVLEIEDEGPGLGSSSPEDLFRPFFTTKEDGTGLGLARARKIVELHGGRMTARTGRSGGAVFRVELPRKERT